MGLVDFREYTAMAVWKAWELKMGLNPLGYDYKAA